MPTAKLKIGKKWRFAIGTTSRVPGSKDLHYLIADFDCSIESMWSDELVTILGQCDRVAVEPTQHGYHLYTDLRVPFCILVRMLRDIGADPAWIRIGKKRGYYYLADKSHMALSWPVERMVIRIRHHG